MAVQTKIKDEWTGIGTMGGIDWKTMGGGGGLGAIISGAIAAGTAATLAGGTTSINGSTGNIATLPKNPVEGNIPLIESETAGTPQTEPKKEEQPTPALTPTPDIKDETSTNVEQSINNTDVLEMLKSLRNEQWAREDEIRKETQAREDNAFSRGIADMRRAGVNVNLVGAQPAESGGGITQATGIDSNIYSAETNKFIALLEQEIDNAFKGDENLKDRFTELIGGLVQTIVAGLLLKK